MKKLLLFGIFLSLGTASCNSSCPAYSSAPPAQHQATSIAPVTASAATPGGQQ